jgi:hypothetical protein
VLAQRRAAAAAWVLAAAGWALCREHLCKQTLPRYPVGTWAGAQLVPRLHATVVPRDCEGAGGTCSALLHMCQPLTLLDWQLAELLHAVPLVGLAFCAAGCHGSRSVLLVKQAAVAVAAA